MKPTTPIAVRFSLMKEFNLSAVDAQTLMSEHSSLEGEALYNKCVEERRNLEARMAYADREEGYDRETIAKINAKLTANPFNDLEVEYMKVNSIKHILVKTISSGEAFYCRFYNFGIILDMADETNAAGVKFDVEALKERMKREMMTRGVG